MSATSENVDFFYKNLCWISVEYKLMQRMGKLNKLRDFSVMSGALTCYGKICQVM